MFVLVGLVVVIGSILTGYTMNGGKVAALMQYTEFIVIGGSAFGSVIIGYNLKSAIGLLTCVGALLKGNPFTKKAYTELLQAMYEIFLLARKGGLMALEKHVENPHESELIQKYPSFAKNHHAVDLFSDTLKLVVMGGISIYDLSDLMDIDLETQHEEAMNMSNVLTTVADSLPGFGIVAAVLGIVITMQAIGGPPEIMGEKVGAALVGTFLGVLLAYGIAAPLAKATESIAKSESAYMACIKNAIVAFARGDAPLICVEFARRNIEPEYRPGFKEMEDTCRGRTTSQSSQSSEEVKAA